MKKCYFKLTQFIVALCLMMSISAWAGPGKVIVKNGTKNTCINNGIRGRGTMTMTPQQKGGGMIIEIPEEQCSNLLYLMSDDMASWIRVEPNQTITVDLKEKEWTFSGHDKEINKYLYEWTHMMYYANTNALTFTVNMMLHNLPNEMRGMPDAGMYTNPEYIRWISELRDNAQKELSKAKLKNSAFVEEQKDRIDYAWLEMLFMTSMLAKNKDITFPIPEGVINYRFTNASLLQYPGCERVLSGYISYCEQQGVINYGSTDFLTKRAELIANPEVREYYICSELHDMVVYGGYQYQVDRVMASVKPYIITGKGREIYAEMEAELEKRVKDPENPIGKPFFSFQLEGIDGEPVTIEQFKGKYVFVDMWATWCGPCKAQIPFLIELERALHGRDIEFLSISTDKQESKDEWKKMVADFGMGGVHAISPDAFQYDLFKKYGVNSIPRFMLISPDGKLIMNNARRPSDPVLQKQLEELLDRYETERSRITVNNVKQGASFRWMKLGSMSTIIASHPIRNTSFYDNTVITKPEFSSVFIGQYIEDKKYQSIFSGTLFHIPGGEVILNFDDDGKVIFSGDKADVNQVMTEIKSRYEERYPKNLHEKVLDKTISKVLVAIYNDIVKDIKASSLSNYDKRMLIGYYQGDLLDKMYNTIIAAKTFGKIITRPEVTENYSQPILKLELVPEITNHYNWESSLQEFLYSCLHAGKVKIKGKNTYTTDMALGLTNSELREIYVVHSLERELMMGYTIELADRVDNAMYLVNKPENRTRLEKVKEGIPDAQQRFKNGLPGTDLSGFSFTDANGNDVSLSDYKGKYIFIDLWSTGCNPCIGEIPYIKEMEHRFKKKPIVWISISLDNKEKVWKDFLESENMTGIQLLCDKGYKDPFIQQMGVYGIPHFILLDTEGRVVDHQTLRPSNPVLGELLHLMLKK